MASRQRSLAVLQEKLSIIASQKKEIARLNEKIASLESEIERRDQAETTSASRLERTRRLMELDDLPVKRKKMIIADLNAVITDQQRQIEDLQTAGKSDMTVADLTDAISEQESSIMELRAEIVAKDKSIAELKQTIDLEDNEELQRALLKSQKSERDLQRQLNELMTVISTRADAHEEGHATLCHAVTGMEVVLAETRSREQALLTEKMTLQTALSKAWAKASDWASRGTTVLARISTLEREFDKLREAVAALAKAKL
jgi:chromosome segregation ATPase